MEGMKLQIPVEAGRVREEFSLDDRIVLLGSCLADNLGGRLAALGLEVLVNPFGTLYNPVSVSNSIARLSSEQPFTEKDCVTMGAGAGLVCSFSHHTSFARPTAREFLDNANSCLEAASKAWRAAGKVIITLGTAWCFEHIRSGLIVSNCLKIDAKEFNRRRLSAGQIALTLRSVVARHPDKEFIFTVSPIRHLKDGAHGNQLSKSALLLGVDETVSSVPLRAGYFPAYEIVMDELRDYRFYATDMIHPSEQTADYLCSRFISWAYSEADAGELARRDKALSRQRHRPMRPESL